MNKNFGHRIWTRKGNPLLMKHQYFQALVQSPDYRSLLINASHIGERYIEKLPVLLFQRRKEYIEVVFTANASGIISSRIFTDTDDLEPYLNQIYISELF